LGVLIKQGNSDPEEDDTKSHGEMAATYEPRDLVPIFPSQLRRKQNCPQLDLWTFNLLGCEALSFCC
jgi:hypothetical protein